MIAGGIVWSTFWAGMGVVGLVIAVLLFLLAAQEGARSPVPSATTDWLRAAGRALAYGVQQSSSRCSAASSPGSCSSRPRFST
jgi:hypothetical protein